MLRLPVLSNVTLFARFTSKPSPSAALVTRMFFAVVESAAPPFTFKLEPKVRFTVLPSSPVNFKPSSSVAISRLMSLPSLSLSV